MGHYDDCYERDRILSNRKKAINEFFKEERERMAYPWFKPREFELSGTEEFKDVASTLRVIDSDFWTEDRLSMYTQTTGCE